MDAAELLEIVRRDLDPVTLAIVEAKLADANRLSIIRDAFMEGKDALAVKMIRNLDEYRMMRLLPMSVELRYREPSGLGLESGGSAQITSRPQVPFRAKHLLLSRACASRISISEIRYGMRSSFVQAGELPGDIFETEIANIREEVDEEGRTRVLDISTRGMERLLQIDLPLVQPGTEITMIITNISDDYLPRFEGAWLGACQGD